MRRYRSAERQRNYRRWRVAAACSVALLATGISPAEAAPAPTWHGPDPTVQSVRAQKGPYTVSTVSVPAGNGFGGGTVFYPTATGEGTFAGIAVSPGFVEAESSIQWYGQTLASQGFAVITISTNGLFDLPSSRADQLLAALKYLTQQSTVKSRVDSARLGVMGHSMGGGGTLEAAQRTPSLKAAVPLAGFDVGATFNRITVPTMVVGAQNDFIAPVDSHSKPFYTSIPASTGKAYLELAGANHLTTNSYSPTIAGYVVSWLKRNLDDDTRYEKFLCPLPTPEPAISDYQGTCPLP